MTTETATPTLIPERKIDNIEIYEYPNPAGEIHQPSTGQTIVVRTPAEAIEIIASMSKFLNAIGVPTINPAVQDIPVVLPKWISISEKPPKKGLIAWMRLYPNGHSQHWISKIDRIGWAINVKGYLKPVSDLDATHWYQLPEQPH